MKILVIILTLIQILITSVYAEVRFVSKTGSSKPPYTSWAMAADRIQKAIDISNRGDTIYVGNGTYVDTVRMTPGIALIGSGMDSCIIDSRPFSYRSSFYTVTVNDSCVFEGFNINVSDDGTGYGIALNSMGNGSVVKYNKIISGTCGIGIGESSPIIRHNIINLTQGDGINMIAMSFYYFPQIDSNYISVRNCTGIMIQFGTMPVIRNNIIFVSGNTGVGFHSGGADSVKFYNNLIIFNSGATGIEASSYNVHALGNVVTGQNRYAGIDAYCTNIIENNCINLNSKYGIIEQGDNPTVRYNNVWGKNVHYYNFVPDSTNQSVDPMFVNPDSMDFHLQMFSPLIHAGNPNIKNVDGTRSDIGIFGGPYGESYTYKDLAPRAPKNVSATLNGTLLKINWEKNTEADFAFYRVYRDTIPGFIPDTTKRIAKTKDTTYTELFKPGRNYYYKISATDNQGNESPKSEEVKLITGVNDKPKIEVEDYTLFANYPNPFNPSTKICYRLRKAGNVSLKVYDIKGSLVKQVLNKWQSAGYYEEEFTGEKGQTTDYVERLASGVYILWMDVKDENNIPVYTTSRKMMMLK